MRIKEKWYLVAIIILSALVILLAVLAVSATAADLWMSRHVERVVDGDTFVFVNGVEDRCRMLGYNAPEKKEDPKLYEAAKQRLAEIFAWSENKIFIFTQGRDNWNRLLCQVYINDGVDVNALMRNWLEDMGYEGVGKYDWMDK